LEWPLCTSGNFIKHIIPIATSGRHSAWGISWGEAQRQSIYSDPKYNNGYYDPKDPPLAGLAAARMAALLTYRTRDSFQSRFGREEHSVVYGHSRAQTESEKALAAHNDGLQSSVMRHQLDVEADNTTHKTYHAPPIFSAQSYLRYQGSKFVSRFDANCYISITRKMDTHDLSRGRAAWSVAIKSLPSRTLFVAISSDGLFTVSEQQEIVDFVDSSRLVILESPEGHDGFLLEFAQLNAIILEHLHQQLSYMYEAPSHMSALLTPASKDVQRVSVFGEVTAIADIASW